jgi:hypothetical protein
VDILVDHTSELDGYGFGFAAPGAGKNYAISSRFIRLPLTWILPQLFSGY